VTVACDRDVLLRILKERANGLGVLRLNITNFAAETGLSPRTVGRMIDDLEQDGKLERLRRGSRKGLLLRLLD
jgi:predicted transcriptional regulator